MFKNLKHLAFWPAFILIAGAIILDFVNPDAFLKSSPNLCVKSFSSGLIIYAAFKAACCSLAISLSCGSFFCNSSCAGL